MSTIRRNKIGHVAFLQLSIVFGAGTATAQTPDFNLQNRIEQFQFNPPVPPPTFQTTRPNHRGARHAAKRHRKRLTKRVGHQKPHQ